MMRHEHIVDLVAAIEARLTALCPSLEFVGRSQATSYKDLAKLIPQLDKLPAAVVVLGPIDSDQERSSQGGRPRVVDVGVMLVGEYSAAQDEGAPVHWAILDEVHDAFTPAVGRSEKPGLPVAVLGDQDGANRGTLLVPAGYRAMSEIPGCCAGVYNLLCLDTVADRIGVPADPADPAAPETGVAALQDLDRFTLWQSTGWARKFISWATIKYLLSNLFAGIVHGSRHETGEADALTPAGIGAEPAQTAASQAEMETGTEAALRSVSPLRVAQAIIALSPQYSYAYDYDATYSYAGNAPGTGTSESAATWTITRIHRTTLATGVAAGVAWTDRETAVYA